jgi:hypothetical protein
VLLTGNVDALPFRDPLLLTRQPSEYWTTNCWIGASFRTREDCLDRHSIGVERIMWGNDFPQEEGTYPFTCEAIRHTFAEVPRHETAAMLGGTAAGLYGFDLDRLAPLAERIGPPVDLVASGLEDLPDSQSLAFESRPVGVG